MPKKTTKSNDIAAQAIQLLTEIRDQLRQESGSRERAAYYAGFNAPPTQINQPGDLHTAMARGWKKRIVKKGRK